MTEASTKTPLIPLLDLKAQYSSIKDEIRNAVDCVFESQSFVLGPEVESFEKEIAAYSQCQFGVGVSSGTDALLVALMAINTRPGDEVITTPYTFFASAGAIARLGAKPVFVDIEPIAFNMDTSLLEAVITSRTKAIMPIHLYGQMANMDTIMDIAQRHDLHVVEDAAQALGAEYKGKRAGSIGHIGCFSFFPSKNLGGFGDGGMVTTNDSYLAERVRLLRNHGFHPKYYNKVIGGNFRLDSLQAAILRVKLKHLDSWTEARQRNAAIYRELFIEKRLAKVQGEIISLPQKLPERRHIFNQFLIRVLHRDSLRAYLHNNGIGTEIYYPVPLHLQECFNYLGNSPGDFPVSERAARETLALPIYPELTKPMIERVVETISTFYREKSLLK